MKYVQYLVGSAIAAGVLIGCGSGNGENNTEVVVERGAVFNAVVTDSSTPPKIAKSKGKSNTYIFKGDIKFPIEVKANTEGIPTFIDVNGNGEADENDTQLTQTLQSCLPKVTMISTLVAKETKCDESKVDKKYESLAKDLNISVDDLKELPSKTQSAKAIKLNNAIYLAYNEDKNATLDKDKLAENLKKVDEILQKNDINSSKADPEKIEKAILEDTNTSKINKEDIHQANNKNSLAVKKAIDKIDAIDFRKDDIAKAIKGVKDELGKADKDDKDAKVANALVSLAEVANSDCLTKFVSVEGGAHKYDEMLPKLLDSGATKKIIGSGDITSCTNDVLNQLIAKTNAAQKTIETTFKDQKYVFKHNEIEFNYQDSLAIRSSALLGATALQVMAAYDKSLDAKDFQEITEKISVKYPYESEPRSVEATYRNMNVDPLNTYYNKPNAFNVQTSSLASAKNYLTQSATLLKDVNISALNIIKQGENSKDVKDMESAKKYAKNILENLSKGKEAPFELKDTNDKVEGKFNLQLFFEKGITKSDITKDEFILKCEKDYKIDKNLSKASGAPQCSNDRGAKIAPKTLPKASESNLDDIYLEIYKNGKVYKGDDLIEYLLGRR